MSRKRKSPNRKIFPDPKYKSSLISKFVNSLMYDGKKTVAEKIIYNALSLIENKNKTDPLKTFNDAVNNIKPNLEVRSRRVGGATYQVPMEVATHRRYTLAIRWLVNNSRDRSGRSMVEKLSAEFVDAYNNTGATIKQQQDTHKMAEANKAFSHFRW